MERRNGTLVAVLGGVVLAALVVVGLVAFAVGDNRSKTTTITVAGVPAAAAGAPVDPQVAAGAHDFVQFACAECHGLQGRGGVSPYVPALTTGVVALIKGRG